MCREAVVERICFEAERCVFIISFSIKCTAPFFVCVSCLTPRHVHPDTVSNSSQHNRQTETARERGGKQKPSGKKRVHSEIDLNFPLSSRELYPERASEREPQIGNNTVIMNHCARSFHSPFRWSHSINETHTKKSTQNAIHMRCREFCVFFFGRRSHK